MDTETLRGELERHFELEDLIDLSSNILGLPPEDVGSSPTKAAFARTLVQRCIELDGLEALVDAAETLRSQFDANVRTALYRGLAQAGDELANGATFGPYSIVRKLGRGPVGTTYLAQLEGKERVIKLFHPDVVACRPAFARYGAVCRLAARCNHPGLPQAVVLDVHDGQHFLAYDHFEAQTLAARCSRGGPMHINEARAILRAILEPLAELHRNRITHGNIKPENILVGRHAEAGRHTAMLLDVGCDRLRLLSGGMVHSSDGLFVVISDARTTAPEQVRGEHPDPRWDVYAFGAVMYEVLTGKALYPNKAGVDAAIAHLSQQPEAPSAAAPRGWVSKEVSDFVLRLVARDPAQRPANAAEVLEAIETLGRVAVAAKPAAPDINEEELGDRVDALVIAPDSEEAAAALDEAVERGADVEKVATAFVMAADQLEGEEPSCIETKKSLLFRAARLYETHLKNLEEAEKIYSWIVELDGKDDIAVAALEETRKRLGKFEEVIEMLIERVEKSTDPEQRAASMSEIGRIYAEHVKDASQAIVAYAQAYAEAPTHEEYADTIERLAANDAAKLGEAITILAEATQGELEQGLKNHIFLRLGAWYGKKLGRMDAALPCYQAIIATEPSHQGALEGMSALFRAAQQYAELGQVLLRRAELATNAARARNLRAEAAELLESRLDQPAKAKELYEQVLAGDPAHEQASEALLRIYEKEQNAAGVVKILERKAEALTGKERADVLVRIGKLLDQQLKDQPEAIKHFEAALQADDTNAEALKALDHAYSSTGQFKQLIGNLERQIALAATPRQKITCYERIAKLWAEEFLDHEQASKALEAVLEIDPANSAALAAIDRHYRALDRWDQVVRVYEHELKITTDSGRRLELALAMARVLSEHLNETDRAMRAYEQALEIDPQHAGALEALAALREQSGDAQAALKAIVALAEKAATPREKAEHYVRAARLLASRGDEDGAIVHYKLALEANPRDTVASNALRAMYAKRNQPMLALELIARETELCDTPAAKAKLCAEAARLAREALKDDARAQISAKEALQHDPNQLEALAILGDLAFEADRPVEASHHYEQIITRLETLPREWAARVMRRFVEGLVKSDATERAVRSCDQLLELGKDDVESFVLAGRVLFEHGDPKRAFQVHQELLDRFGAKLVGTDKSEALYRHGESARRSGDALTAIKSLSEASDMDPTAAAPLQALAKVYETKGDWEEVIRVKSRRLDVASGEERVELLVEVGEIAAGKLNDQARAAKSLTAALEERPNDRRLLTRLMQLYSESKDWSKLIDVVLKLADFVDDPKQKAKYVFTAAGIASSQLQDVEKALECLERVIELDPDHDKALQQALQLRTDRGDLEGVERLLKLRLDRATQKDDREVVLKTFDELGELYHHKLEWIDEAIDAYEAAQMLEPENTERNALLADLYASNPTQYLDKALASQRELLKVNSNRPGPYKLLRRLYTEAKQADPAWCFCQALAVLGLAAPDEERFYQRMRCETAAPAQTALVEEQWVKALMHEDADPVLSGIMLLIEPAVLATRADTLERLGYDVNYAIDLARHPYAMSQMIYYGAGVMAIELPPTFQNINDEGGISFLHAQVPSIVLGRAAFEVEVPQQAAAFIVGRHLTYYRPGFYIRHLVPTGTGLKAWVFAAIKMNAPQFPISPDLEGPVAENLKALHEHLNGPTKERLASLVSKLLTGAGSLDLKKWVAAVDLTADRAGFLLCHDLETATEMIKASDESSSSVPHKERLKQLVLFSISEQYFNLRRHLQIAVDS